MVRSDSDVCDNSNWLLKCLPKSHRLTRWQPFADMELLPKAGRHRATASLILTILLEKSQVGCQYMKRGALSLHTDCTTWRTVWKVCVCRQKCLTSIMSSIISPTVSILAFSLWNCIISCCSFCGLAACPIFCIAWVAVCMDDPTTVVAAAVCPHQHHKRVSGKTRRVLETSLHVCLTTSPTVQGNALLSGCLPGHQILQ